MARAHKFIVVFLIGILGVQDGYCSNEAVLVLLQRFAVLGYPKSRKTASDERARAQVSSY
jgi:hypothetical protein